MEATVEVLTAEVRTLMVGSRQVTLSVYKQLDEEDWNQIEAFGRVRTNAAQSDRCELVGRRISDGALVRSSIHRTPIGAKWWFDEFYAGPAWCEVLGAWSYAPSGTQTAELRPRDRFKANLGAWSVDVPATWQVLINPDSDDALPWDGWRFADGTEPLVRDAMALCEKREKETSEAIAELLGLPLIVLAGLR